MVPDDNGTVPHANTPNDKIKEYLDCRYEPSLICKSCYDCI